MTMTLRREGGAISASVPSRRFLIAHWDGGGNNPPVLALVKRLVSRGHEVRVVCDPSARADFEPTGASFAEWRRAPRRADRSAECDPLKDWEVSAPPALIGRIRDRIMVGPALAYAQDLWEEQQQFDPDMVCVNDLLLGPMIAAEKSGRPTAVLAPNICMVPLPGVPAFGPGFMPANGWLGRARDAMVNGFTKMLIGRGTSSFNEARRSLGLAPIAHPLEQLHRMDRYLIMTSRAFDFEPSALPSTFTYVGPQLDDPAWTGEWRSPWPDDDPRPLVVVGFSTTFMNQAAVVARVVEALGRTAARAVVTVGPGLGKADLPSPPNVHVVPAAPHSALLRHAALMITHAGHGTVIRSLAAGVPVLCMPMGRDQNDNAARVAHRGVGKRLSPTAGVAEIGRAIVDLLGDEPCRTRARAMGEQIRREAEASPVIDILEEMAGVMPGSRTS